MAAKRNNRATNDLRKALLMLLQKDSSRPNKDLAFELSVDPATLSRLRDRLESEGYIKGYSAILNSEKCGFATLAFVMVALVETDESSVTSAVKLLTDDDRVQEIHNIEGQFDLLLKLRVRTNAEVTEFIQHNLTRKNNFKDTQTMLTMGTFKETSWLPT